MDMKRLAATVIGMFVMESAIAGGSTTAHVTNVRIDQTGSGTKKCSLRREMQMMGLRRCGPIARI